jgi:hypothetical protein
MDGSQAVSPWDAQKGRQAAVIPPQKMAGRKAMVTAGQGYPHFPAPLHTLPLSLC